MVNKFLEFLFKFIYSATHENNNSASSIPLIISVLAIILTIINSAFGIFSFVYKDKKEDSNRDRNLRLDWYKSLILNSNFSQFNDFFDNIELEMSKLKTKKNTQKKKENINDLVIDQRNKLKRKFIDLLQIADKDLQKQVLVNIDNLTDYLTEKIFSDTEFNNPAVFEELVSNTISDTKIKITNSLYNYCG